MVETEYLADVIGSVAGGSRSSRKTGRAFTEVLLGKKRKGRMNSLIELHDSEVGALAEVGEQVILFFSGAYVHRSPGRPARDSGTGWWQAAALVFAEASVEGEAPQWPAEIWTGELILDGQGSRSMIPIPFVHPGEVALRLHLSSPAEITIRGRGATLTLLGEPEYVEEFRGDE
jgi:hypothetical protein